MITALNSDHGGPRSDRISAISRGRATTAVATTADPSKPRRRSRFPFRGTTTATAAVWALGPSPLEPPFWPGPRREEFDRTLGPRTPRFGRRAGDPSEQGGEPFPGRSFFPFGWFSE
jgi:hypothetical protein